MSKEYLSCLNSLGDFALASFNGYVIAEGTVVDVEEYLTTQHARVKSVFTDRIMKHYFQGVQNYIDAHLPKSGEVARLGIAFEAVSIQHEANEAVQILRHEDMDLISDYRILDEDMHLGFIPKNQEYVHDLSVGKNVTTEIGWILESLPPSPPTPIVRDVLGYKLTG